MGKTFFNRRQFIKAALYGSTAVAALAPFSIGRGRAQALADTKVIVVGAGIAGLGAAKSLAEQGAEVVVLEVKPHIGGRLFTDYSMGAPFEYGAGWIHGPSEDNPTKQLADAVNAQTIVTDNNNMIVFDDEGEELDDEELEEIDEDWADTLWWSQMIDATLYLQHRDGVYSDGSKSSSRFQYGGENRDVGSLAAR